MKIPDIVIVTEPITGRPVACYTEIDGVRIDLPAAAATRSVSCEDVQQTTLTFNVGVRWEEQA